MARATFADAMREAYGETIGDMFVAFRRGEGVMKVHKRWQAVEFRQLCLKCEVITERDPRDPNYLMCRCAKRREGDIKPVHWIGVVVKSYIRPDGKDGLVVKAPS